MSPRSQLAVECLRTFGPSLQRLRSELSSGALWWQILITQPINITTHKHCQITPFIDLTSWPANLPFTARYPARQQSLCGLCIDLWSFGPCDGFKSLCGLDVPEYTGKLPQFAFSPDSEGQVRFIWHVCYAGASLSWQSSFPAPIYLFHEAI